MNAAATLAERVLAGDAYTTNADGTTGDVSEQDTVALAQEVLRLRAALKEALAGWGAESRSGHDHDRIAERRKEFGL